MSRLTQAPTGGCRVPDPTRDTSVWRSGRGPDTHLRMVQGCEGQIPSAGAWVVPPLLHLPGGRGKEVQEKPPAGSLRVSLRSLFNIPQEWGIKGVETSLRQRWWEQRE